MGRALARLPCLWFGPAAMSRVRINSSVSSASKSFSNSAKHVNGSEFSSNERYDFGSGEADNETQIGNKIMVVVDSSLEAKGALDWALSHTVQSQDTIVLVHVAKPSRQESSGGKLHLKAYQLLLNMKNICQTKRPGVQVQFVILEGKEKGKSIVEEAKQQKVSLLVTGQRKRSMLWCLMKRWGRKRARTGFVEYCIQNSACMTIAVRRKSSKLGGYLITTKRHKKFWLLA
ncbi:hypothetical protein L6164_011275 [Bauhinia variegata]|uniref:Uncharacterized protein n=1 Tax=Bauhinia variegata TaxID=167791 RepID=A0ACB9P7J3_BAUVA|nr:hypothetical protein L6164_011275 [Bauhinia variegata]